MENVVKAIYAHGTAYCLLFAALMTPPSVLSHGKLAVAFVPLIWSCHIYAGKFGLGYISAIHALWSAELLLFRDPRRDFALLHFTPPPRLSPFPAIPTTEDKKIGGEDVRNAAAMKAKKTARNEKPKVTDNASHKKAWTESYPQSLWKRFFWVFKLVLSLRYIGWATSESQKALYSSRPPPLSKSRLIFLIQKLCLIGSCIAVLDAVHFYQHFDPYMQIESSIDEAFPRRLGGFFKRHYLGFLSPRFVRIIVSGLEQYCTFALLGSILAVIFVTLGTIDLVDDFWGRPENWSDVMGSPITIAQKGLRGFWGDFWHQLFRNLLVGPGKFLTRVLHLSSGSAISYAIQVAMAFGLSGIVSSAGLPRDSKTIHPLQCASFLWIQGALVLCEVIFIRAMAIVGFNEPKSHWETAALAFFNLSWTGLVLYHTVPLIQNEMTRVSRMYGLKTVFFIAFPE